MGKVAKNLSLLKRTSNRLSNRPPTSSDAQTNPEEDEAVTITRKEKRASEKRAQKDTGGFFWDNLQGKLFYPYSYMDSDWRLSLTTIFKVIFMLSIRGQMR